METVEVVIRLPKEVYEKIQQIDRIISGRRSGKTIEFALWNGVKNGTVLPKNHGRLVDADKISRVNYAEEDNLTGYGMTYDEMGAYNDGINDMYRLVKNAPTVIEADKEKEND